MNYFVVHSYVVDYKGLQKHRAMWKWCIHNQTQAFPTTLMFKSPERVSADVNPGLHTQNGASLTLEQRLPLTCVRFWWSTAAGIYAHLRRLADAQDHAEESPVMQHRRRNKCILLIHSWLCLAVELKSSREELWNGQSAARHLLTDTRTLNLR